MIETLVIAGCAWANRMAGGGWPDLGVVTGRVGTAVMVGVLASLVQHWSVAAAFGVGYFVWRAFSWGWLIGGIAGGHRPTARPTPSPVEGMLLDWFGPHGGMFARMLFVLPTLVVAGYLLGNPLAPTYAAPFALLATLSYDLAWRLYPQQTIPLAEIAVGALWGALILVV